MRLKRSAAAAVVLTCAGAAMAHPYGWRVGQTDTGELTIDFLWNMSHHLNDSITGYGGWADRDLAFEEFPADNPPINLFVLDPGGKIELVVDSFSPGLSLRDSDDLPTAINQPGQSWSIGSSGTGFNNRPWWHLDPDADGFEPRGIWYASFHLRDISGVHADSQTYTFKLIVPAPATTGLLAAGGLLAVRRRR